ncbi:radical SAM protein [candidate division KSB1 bacterium]|nr:radical SAM protein [candidate division KSB1 bacterium]
MIKHRQTRSLLRTAKQIDTWFLGKYQIGLYRGCQHACIYCDGRYEKYNFEGEFGTDIEIKANGLDLLQKELERVKEPGFTFIGSGITDAYQPLEAKCRLSRQALQMLNDKNMPVHVLTKSALIERDFDLYENIAKKSTAIISFSITSDNERTRQLLEPRTAPLSERWRILKAARERGINTGAMLLPVIPFISDSAEEMDRMLQKASEAEVDFVMFGGMTLKSGRQKDFFMDFIRQNIPRLEPQFIKLYANNDPYGQAVPPYYEKINSIFYPLARKYGIQIRIPRELFSGVIPCYTEAAILLAHIGDYLQTKGIRRKAYQYAGYAIQKWAFELKKKIGRKKEFHYTQIEEEFKRQVKSGDIKKLSGIGETIYNMLLEYINTGKISYYEQVRRDYMKMS